MSQAKTEQQPETTQSDAERTRSGNCFTPSVDILEDKESLKVVADMPGASAESIDIDYERGELTIHGRVDARHPDNGHMKLREYGVGDYYRAFRVAEEIDPRKISADYVDGILTIELPKAEAAKPKRITVNPK